MYTHFIKNLVNGRMYSYVCYMTDLYHITWMDDVDEMRERDCEIDPAISAGWVFVEITKLERLFYQ